MHSDDSLVCSVMVGWNPPLNVVQLSMMLAASLSANVAVHFATLVTCWPAGLQMDLVSRVE